MRSSVGQVRSSGVRHGVSEVRSGLSEIKKDDRKKAEMGEVTSGVR